MTQTGHPNSKVEDTYIQRLINMPKQKRIKITSELSELTRELTRQGIRKRNPGLTKEEIEKTLWQIIYKK